MTQLKWILAAATFALGVTFAPPTNAFAQSAPRNLLASFDEAGNTPGSDINLTSGIAADTGPGGHAVTFAYFLPASFSNMVEGDVYILDGIPPPGAPTDFSDQLRFIGGVHPMILVYSDAPPFEFTSDMPESLWPTGTWDPFTTVSLVEDYLGWGWGSARGVLYTPNQAQPGYLSGVNMTYRFISGAVPEPATWAMMLLGFGAVGGALRSASRRQKLTFSRA